MLFFSINIKHYQTNPPSLSRFCLLWPSVSLNDLLHGLLADWTLLINHLRTLLAEASMATRHHYSVNFASHAHLAVIVRACSLNQLAWDHLSWVHHPLAWDGWKVTVLHHHHLLLLGSRSHSWVCYVVIAASHHFHLLWRNERILKFVDVVRVCHMVQNELWIFLMDATLVQKVLNFDKVHAHANHLLQEVLLSLAEEVDLLLVASKRSLLGEFLLNSALALLS